MTAKKKYSQILGKLKKTSGIFVIDGEIVEEKYTEDKYDGIVKALDHYNKRPSKKRYEELAAFFEKVQAKITNEKKQKSLEVKINTISKKYPNLVYDAKIGVYLKGVKVAMPDVLEQKIVRGFKAGEDLTALINFWRLLLLNPNENSRINFYKYIVNNPDFTITPNGYVLMYRRVKKKKEQTNIYPEYIAEMYLKAKAQKKSPSKLILMMKDDMRDTLRLHSINAKTETWVKRGYTILHDGELLSDLHDKYEKSDGKTVYTCARTGDATHGTTIIMGEPVTMPRELCDEDIHRSCSRGLHLGSISWVGTGYIRDTKSRNAGFGDHLIACLLNPRDAVAIPYNDQFKMRCCKYFPFAVITGKTAHDVKNMNLSQFDSDYMDIEDSEIDHLLKNYKGLKSKEYINNNLNLREIKSIVNARSK